MTSGDFEEIHHVFLDRIRYNMTMSVQYGNCGDLNTTDSKIMNYYVKKSENPTFYRKTLHFM